MIYIEDFFSLGDFKMKKFAIALAVIVASATVAQAQFETSLNDENGIVITNNLPTNPVKLFGIELGSTAGGLEYGGPEPFAFAFQTTANAIQLADPNGAVEIDGSVTLNIKYNTPESGNDLEVVISPVSGQGVDTAQVSAPFVPVGGGGDGGGDPVIPEPASGLLAALGALGLLGFRQRR